MEVDLRAVECAVTLVDDIVKTKALQCILQAIGRSLPVLIGAHGILRAGGQLHEIVEAKLGVDLVNQMHNALDLVGNLVRAHKDVRIVLSEAADTEQTVKRTAQFVAVNDAQLADPQGQLTIAVGLRAVVKQCSAEEDICLNLARASI